MQPRSLPFLLLRLLYCLAPSYFLPILQDPLSSNSPTASNPTMHGYLRECISPFSPSKTVGKNKLEEPIPLSEREEMSLPMGLTSLQVRRMHLGLTLPRGTSSLNGRSPGQLPLLFFWRLLPHHKDDTYSSRNSPEEPQRKSQSKGKGSISASETCVECAIPPLTTHPA